MGIVSQAKMNLVNYHFKAATGFGAVIDGCVASSSAGQVARDLIKQGLIPVRIWPEHPPKAAFDLRGLATALGRWIGRWRASFHNP